jgi:hypothetical protein
VPAHHDLRVLERWGVAEAVAGIAVLAAARADADTAAVLTGASEATYAEVEGQVIAPDASLAAPFLAKARRELADADWLAARDRGRGSSIEEAADRALEYARD